MPLSNRPLERTLGALGLALPAPETVRLIWDQHVGRGATGWALGPLQIGGIGLGLIATDVDIGGRALVSLWIADRAAMVGCVVFQRCDLPGVTDSIVRKAASMMFDLPVRAPRSAGSSAGSSAPCGSTYFKVVASWRQPSYSLYDGHLAALFSPQGILSDILRGTLSYTGDPGPRSSGITDLATPAVRGRAA